MQLYSLSTLLVAALFLAGIIICLYWSRTDKPRIEDPDHSVRANSKKGPTAIILLALILLSGCTRQVASGIYPVKRWKGYQVVRQIQPDCWDCGYTKYVIRNDKRFIELYAPLWFGDVYAIGDTIQ